MGGSEALASFLTFGWSLGSGESPAGGGAPGGIRERCQNELAQITHILGREERVFGWKSQEAAGRVAFSLPVCLQNLKGNHMLY